MVYYRKYRPQTIEELDSQELREKLQSLLAQENISHAFLFTGPKGLGKTSAARIVAKVVNCQKKSKIKNQKLKVQVQSQKLENKNIEPCNECDQCVSITKGTNLDVLEIDGASNRGIDEIRDLREKVKLAPIAAAKKVYIIDEVHMLTTEAFNALLKTLEEPPPHVLFILATTEPHKIPATIFSRCLNITFKKATEKELERSFKRIAKSEKLEIDKEALTYIASLSEGSFRDGVKILEELSVNKDKKITKELIETKYKLTNIRYQIEKMLNVFAKKETKEGLKLIGELTENGVDFKYFIEQLISELHQLLLIEAGVLKEESKVKLTIEEIKELVKLLANAYTETKYTVLPQLPLEIAVIEWTLEKYAEVANENFLVRDAKKVSSSTSTINPANAHRENFISSPHLDKPSSAEFSDKKIETQKKDGDLEEFWRNLIEGVKRHNHSVAGVLRGCSLKSFDGKNLMIEAKYKFHKERLEEKKTQEILEKTCEEIYDSPIKISVSFKI